MEVHLFGATSSPSCANFPLRKTADDNRGEFPEDIINAVKRNFYVDDCLKSVKSSGCAIEFVVQLRHLLSKGGFRLTKWLCNREEVLESTPESERAPSVLYLDSGQERLPAQRTLGLKWDMGSDKFTFKVDLKDKPNTRRGILSLTSSVYDPLSFLAPIIVPAKKLLQALCRKKLNWDDLVGEIESQTWEKWKEQLSSLSQIAVNRSIKPVNFGELKLAELHNCADASLIACGAVSYLRLVGVEDKVHCTFLMGKSRLAHLKPMTVPRLELSAAVLAVQLDKTLKEELDIPVAQLIFWSDSTCVLRYIRNQSKRLHTFVAKRWLSGPQFLKEEREFWPLDYSLQHQELPDDDQEVKQNPNYHCQILMRGNDRNVLSRLIERCPSWERLRRTVAWLLRFKRWFIGQRSPSPVSTVCTSAKPSLLSVDEVQVAEREVLRHVQRLSFPDVFQALQGLGQSSSPRQVMSELKDLKTTASMRKLVRG